MSKASQRIAVLISPDDLSRSLLFDALNQIPRESILVIADQSMSTRKVFKLLAKKRIRLTWLVKKLLSNRQQASLIRKKTMIEIDRTVTTNNELAAVLREYPQLTTLLGFRASLIVQGFITENIPSLNIHCARIPEYVGLGAIANALSAGDYHQVATLHEMVSKIDSGKVIDEEPYTMDPGQPYWQNELIAYQAAIPLIQRLSQKALNTAQV